MGDEVSVPLQRHTHTPQRPTSLCRLCATTHPLIAKVRLVCTHATVGDRKPDSRPSEFTHTPRVLWGYGLSRGMCVSPPSSCRPPSSSRHLDSPHPPSPCPCARTETFVRDFFRPGLHRAAQRPLRAALRRGGGARSRSRRMPATLDLVSQLSES